MQNIEALFLKKDYKNCLSDTQKLLDNLKRHQSEDTQELDKLRQWLTSYTLLCKLNTSDELASDQPEFPATTKDEYIQWCLAVARAAAIGTETICQSLSNEYTHYVKALNAGSEQARLLIIRCHLLGNLDRGLSSPEGFLPTEAIAHMKVISERVKNGIPAKPESMNEDHYQIVSKLVEMIRDKKDCTRSELTETLTGHSDPEIKLLTPMLYLDTHFGRINLKEALKHIQTLAMNIVAEQKQQHPLWNVFEYWLATCNLNHPSVEKPWVNMAKLAERELFPAALYSLLTYYQTSPNQNLAYIMLDLLEKHHWVSDKPFSPPGATAGATAGATDSACAAAVKPDASFATLQKTVIMPSSSELPPKLNRQLPEHNVKIRFPLHTFLLDKPYHLPMAYHYYLFLQTIAYNLPEVVG